jgi:hypothetical protein
LKDLGLNLSMGSYNTVEHEIFDIDEDDYIYNGIKELSQRIHRFVQGHVLTILLYQLR